MPIYYSIKSMQTDERRRTVTGLKRLRYQLDTEMPQKTRNETLVLGTWNIRNFDDNRFGHGKRSKEDLFYIAEILSRFDIIAVQEICEDLAPLDEVMGLLGWDYDYILTDKTEGRSGNSERLGFIYDKAKVAFKGVAGELVLPEHMLIATGERKLQFSRTPFMCTFQSGWFKFSFSTVHIYFGSNSGKKFKRRINEIQKVAKFLAKRAKRDGTNHILVGDFNIPKNNDRSFNALFSHGFTIFQNQKGSNAKQTKFYDQISFMSKQREVQLYPGQKAKGVFQFFNSVFRSEDFPNYRSVLITTLKTKIMNYEAKIEEAKNKISLTRSEKMKEKYRKVLETESDKVEEAKATIYDDKQLETYYRKTWRTFHASDHLPLWVELKIDFSQDYLDKLERL